MKKILSIIAAICIAVNLVNCSAEEDISVFGGIYGVVTDADTNQPVQGANVVLSPTNVSTVTGADGSYVFSELDAQQYKLIVTASGYQYNSRQVTVVAGQSVAGDINISTEVETTGFSLSPTSLVFGNIYSEMTFTITNTGNSSATTWSISGIDESWLSVSPSSGTTAVGNSSVVKVSIDRSLVTDDVVTYFIVNAGGGSKQILVSASEGSGDESTATNSISLNKSSLAFGETSDNLSFTVTNSGVEDITFSLLGNYSWIKGADPASGTFSAMSTKSITIYIDRDYIYGSVSGVLTVSTSEGDYYLTMSAYEPIDYGTFDTDFSNISVAVSDVYVSGTSLYVEYKATNTGSTTWELKVLGGSSNNTISDNEGNSYGASSLTFSLGGDSYSATSKTASVSSGGVTKGGVKISSIDSDATELTSVKIYCTLTKSGSIGTYGYIYLYNVPIIR